MKDLIIKRSISELQRIGLRFSIDEVAKSLKISKKTIYKYFCTKEDLAIAIYKEFYEEATRRLEACEFDAGFGMSERAVVTQMLTVYFQSYCMVRKDIFNKYALNDGIRSLAQENHDKIKACVRKKLLRSDGETLMIVIDGSLQALCERREYDKEVIDILVTLIC